MHSDDERNTTRDLCRRWRYTEAKLKADLILAEEEDTGRLAEETEDQLKAIEEQILAAAPAGAGDAAEILYVVSALLGEDSHYDGRDTALLRQALKALAWSDESWSAKPAA